MGSPCLIKMKNVSRGTVNTDRIKTGAFPGFKSRDRFMNALKDVTISAEPFCVLFFRLNTSDVPESFAASSEFSIGRRLLARLILQMVYQRGNPDDFVAYLSGPDFAVITTPERADSIGFGTILVFDAELAQRRRNSASRDVRNFQSMSMSIGVVSSVKMSFSHPFQIVHIGNELVTYVSKFPGNKFIIDRRCAPRTAVGT